MDYSNLKNKTVYDFCDDVEVLDFIMGKKSASKGDYLKSTDKERRLEDLAMLVFITANDDLGEALCSLHPVLIEWDNTVCDFAERYQRKHGLADD